MICNIYILILESVINYALGTKLSIPRVKKRIEKPSEKVRNNKKKKNPVHIRDEKKIGINCLFVCLFLFFSFLFFSISLIVVNESGVFFFFQKFDSSQSLRSGTIVKRYVNILIIIIYSCICDLIVNREVRSLCEWRDQLEKYFDFLSTRSL